MKKDNILKRFLTVTVLALCVFSLFSGVIVAKNNTQRSLRGIDNEKIDEIILIKGIKNIYAEISSELKAKTA